MVVYLLPQHDKYLDHKILEQALLGVSLRVKAALSRHK
ncbi:hypothetical protein LP43_2090 [Methylophaga thiooxydans]|uniref:Uncharacterized protein n=1 Tax=Methylophaga thiooxydans TaxID=392484 RepID=A0A0A0BEY9_9GAMM|nr:hypothetical protein LP43_2090 [Methylophaga thiooxydans]